MSSAHLICRNSEGIFPSKFPHFTCEAWDIPEEDAAKLIGGMLHFHETKASRSYFGGMIKGFEVVYIDAPRPKRIKFTLESTANGRGARWQGVDSDRAWYSGVVG